MSKDGGETIVYLHSKSLASERRNQLALIGNQLFVDDQVYSLTGESRIETNKFNNQVRYLATAHGVETRQVNVYQIPVIEKSVQFAG